VTLISPIGLKDEQSNQEFYSPNKRINQKNETFPTTSTAATRLLFTQRTRITTT